MKNKECFLVTAYCNTEEKKQVLLNTLNSLKRYNKEIILFSHFPITEEENLLTNYSVYDYSNPMIDINEGSILHWKMVENYRLCTLYVDYGYAAVQQWKRGLLFANMLEFEKVYVLNYDLNVTDDLVYLSEKGLMNHKSVLLDYDLPQSERSAHMSWAAIKPLHFANNILEINYQDYLKTAHGRIPEGYIFNKFNSDETQLILPDQWQPIATTLISMGDKGFVEEYYTGDGFKWILGQEKIYNQGEETLTNKTVLFFWDIEKELDVEVFIDGKAIPLRDIKTTDRTLQIYVPIPSNEMENYVGKFINNTFEYVEDRLRITINGLEIDKELLRLSTISAIETIND